MGVCCCLVGFFLWVFDAAFGFPFIVLPLSFFGLLLMWYVVVVLEVIWQG